MKPTINRGTQKGQQMLAFFVICSRFANHMLTNAGEPSRAELPDSGFGLLRVGRRGPPARIHDDAAVGGKHLGELVLQVVPRSDFRFVVGARL